MARANIYIWKSNEEAWAAKQAKSEWVNQMLEKESGVDDTTVEVTADIRAGTKEDWPGPIPKKAPKKKKT